jgi:hypothetical protein
LLISQIAANQSSKEITANAAFDDLDLALTNKLTHAMTDADYTLADPSEARQNLVFVFTGAITANRNIILPAAKKLYVVSNQTTGGHNLVFKALIVGSPPTFGVSISVSPSAYTVLYCDGTDVIALSAAPSIDVAVFSPGVGTNSQVLLRINLARSVTFPASATLSQATASAAATASTTFTFKKNGSSFATVNYGAGNTNGVFTQASSSTFVAGDLLEIDGPSTADATLADVGLTLVGIRN